ncbi:MAG: isoaspartyl peptidase/L-asparaginase, partial [Phycisphaerales bacterium]|nr:isoaspartyl peptidase/L-asparaginase [Phycisphaerales bacterium]
MASPFLLSTWSFSEPILESEYPNLSAGCSALDAVEACVRNAEQDESIDSVGFGGLPDRNGNCTFDAMVMTSPSSSGAVCGIERHLHPVSIARLVMEKTNHTLLSGSLADDFADSHEMKSSDILADSSKQKWEHWKKTSNVNMPAPFDHGHGKLSGSHDTIGTLALDTHGILAGACSTSGMAWKVPGRVGDSPI